MSLQHYIPSNGTCTISDLCSEVIVESTVCEKKSVRL